METPDPIKRVMASLQQFRSEAQGGLRTRLLTEMMRGSFRDAHEYDSGPVEFDAFDTNPSIGAGQITGTVGGADVTLFASTAATNEAGLIVIQRSDQWVLSAGAGGWQGWGIVDVDWSIQGITGFSSQYQATPSTGYLCKDVFAVDLQRAKAYKPLHGRSIQSGGAITVRMIVRPLGPAGTTVVWPGGTLTAISSAACNMIQKMTVWGPSSYGPIHMRALFQGCNAPCLASGSGEGRKALISRLFGQGKIGSFLGHAAGLVSNGSNEIK